MSKEDAIKVQWQFLLRDQFTAIETLLDGAETKIIPDSGGKKSFISKQFYVRNKSLYKLSKFSSNGKVIQGGNGASGNILVIIPIIITVQGHMSGIYTMISEIHHNVHWF